MSDTLPDARQDLAGAINAGNQLLMQLLRERAAQKVSATRAARQLGYNLHYFHGRPWRIPGFGLHGSMHTLAEWNAWLDRPEAQRHAEWDAMSLTDRRKAQGIV